MFINRLKYIKILPPETKSIKYDKNLITIGMKNVVRGIEMKKNSEIDAAKQQLVEELEAARLIALETKSSAAMVSASIGKAKILGLISEKNKKDPEEDKQKIQPVLVQFVAEMPPEPKE